MVCPEVQNFDSEIIFLLVLRGRKPRIEDQLKQFRELLPCKSATFGFEATYIPTESIFVSSSTAFTSALSQEIMYYLPFCPMPYQTIVRSAPGLIPTTFVKLSRHVMPLPLLLLRQGKSVQLQSKDLLQNKFRAIVK